eukprot:GHVT01013219.1.p1 GENE.GHVT01013219.1~~GHVT01013219.1.p1  ORF type:complete len:336 (+),score=7.95 GHVT01013219.1:294-1301(+)
MRVCLCLELLLNLSHACDNNRIAVDTNVAIYPFDQNTIDFYTREFPSASLACKLIHKDDVVPLYSVGFPDPVDVINYKPKDIDGALSSQIKNNRAYTQISELLPTNTDNVVFSVKERNNFASYGVIVKGMKVGDLGFLHEQYANNLCLIATAIRIPLALVTEDTLDETLKSFSTLSTPEEKSAALVETTEFGLEITVYGGVKVLSVNKDGVLEISVSNDSYVDSDLVPIRTSLESIKPMAAKSLLQLPEQEYLNGKQIEWKSIHNSLIAIQSDTKKLKKQGFEESAIESYRKYASGRVAMELHEVKTFYTVKSLKHKKSLVNNVEVNLNSKTAHR